MSAIRYRTTEVDGLKVFYREAQNIGAPKLSSATFQRRKSAFSTPATLRWRRTAPKSRKSSAIS